MGRVVTIRVPRGWSPEGAHYCLSRNDHLPSGPSDPAIIEEDDFGHLKKLIEFRPWGVKKVA